MGKFGIFCFVAILIFLTVPTSAQDQTSKQPNIQIVIHRLQSSKPNETYELFYNPRELRLSYLDREYGVKERVQEYLVCSNITGDVIVAIFRYSKKQYGVFVEVSNGLDYSKNFPDLGVSTSFSSLKEDSEILSSILHSNNTDTYQVSVRATRYHAFQGGSVLQCSKQSLAGIH